MDLSIRVIAFNTFCDRSHFASRHPHLSVVQVFKDRFRRAVSFDSSAAERRDYEEPSKLRQALRTTFFNLPSPPTPPETPGTAERCALYTHLNRSQALLENIKNESQKGQIDSPAVTLWHRATTHPVRMQSLQCRQRDIHHAANHQKLVLTLKNSR